MAYSQIMKQPPPTEALTILLAPVVIDRALKVIADGFVAVRGDRTICTGGCKRLSIPKGARVIRLENSILLPGLVNAHCHLDYTLMKGAVPASGGFSRWIPRMVEIKRSWSDADYLKSIQLGMRQCVDSGTTTIANITCVPHLVSSLDLVNAPRIWWFVELLDLGRTVKPDEGRWMTWIKPRFERQHFSLSPHALYTVTPALWKKALAFCDRRNLPWTAHLGESRDEWKMFQDASGPLFELVKKAGRDMSDCGGVTPLTRGLQLGARGRAPAILAHMNCLSESDLRLLKRRRARLSIAHCPRSHAFFRHPPFQLNELRAAGVNLALGTDSLASNRDLNLFSEMRKVKQNLPRLPSRAVVAMATQNGALALGQARNWPRWADWIAVDRGRGDPFKAIIQFAESPKFVMVAGSVVKKLI